MLWPEESADLLYLDFTTFMASVYPWNKNVKMTWINLSKKTHPEQLWIILATTAI